MKCFRAFSVGILVSTAPFCAAADFTTGQAARAVIGQINFTQGDPGASNTLVGAVSGIAYANDMLFVADANRFGALPINNRVLIYQNLSRSIPKPTDILSFTENGGTCPVCVGSADVVLGQPDFGKTDPGLTQSGLRLPTAVASDGHILAVADTDNNRVLIWKTIPATPGTQADVVIGQSDFTHGGTLVPPSAKSLRGPQGVWIQGNKLFIADTQDNRVLIYNSIPTSNGAQADVVLGQTNFTTFVQADITKGNIAARNDNLLNPVAVTSDGQRLFVTDLGYNRVLIWNNIPSSNNAPADLELGQPDFTTSDPNNASNLCPSNGTDTNSKPTYPARCGKTLSFPRFALAGGNRLFVADGGNDRVLVYSTIPTSNAQAPDLILGQTDENTDESSAGTDRLQTPASLAWDGLNLYVGDTYNRRILVYTPAEQGIPLSGVRNAASREVFAIGGITLGGTLKEADQVTITINGKAYVYKIVKDDTFANVVNQLVKLINTAPGDPNVVALPNTVTQGLVLTARQGGQSGTAITYSTTLSDNAQITAATAGANLTANFQDAAKIAPGTLISILGSNLADSSAVASFQGRTFLPTELAGTQLYIDGIRAPLLFVSPSQINAQLPFETLDRTSVSVYTRTQHADGSVTVTTPVAVTIVGQNPGIFADESGQDPRPGLIFHSSALATGVISVDGAIKAADIATVTIEDRTYTYTVQATDTLLTVRDALIAMINNDPKVTATATNVFTRILLQAKAPGADGNGIAYAATVNTGAQLILSALGSATCCAGTADARVTPDNPAVPGEVLYLYATGLGVTYPGDGSDTGKIFAGPVNPPDVPIDSILAGGKTANVLSVGLVPGQVGVYQVQFQLNSDLPADPFTQLTIAQQDFVSNVVTFPVQPPATQ